MTPDANCYKFQEWYTASTTGEYYTAARRSSWYPARSQCSNAATLTGTNCTPSVAYLKFSSEYLTQITNGHISRARVPQRNRASFHRRIHVENFRIYNDLKRTNMQIFDRLLYFLLFTLHCIQHYHYNSTYLTQVMVGLLRCH